MENKTYSFTNTESTVLMRIGTVLFLLKSSKICVRCSTDAQPINKMMRVFYLLPRCIAQSSYAYTHQQ